MVQSMAIKVRQITITVLPTSKPTMATLRRLWFPLQQQEEVPTLLSASVRDLLALLVPITIGDVGGGIAVIRATAAAEAVVEVSQQQRLPPVLVA